MSKTAQVVKDSHPDWQAFNGKAEQAVVFSNYAYSQKDEEMQAMADQVPEGYELFLMTDHVQEVGEASFRCVAFMNQNTKEIVFATAWSRFSNEELKKALAKIAVAVVKEVATSMVDRVMKGKGAKKPLDKTKETAPKLELPTVHEVAKASLSK